MTELDSHAILKDWEIEELYGVPQFNDEQREHYFDLNDAEQALYSRRNDPIVNAYRILLLGYLKYKPLTYSLDVASVKTDLEFIRKKFSLQINLRKAELTPTQKTRIYDSVLSFCGYYSYSESKQKLEIFVTKIADQYINPRELFDRCVQYLMEHKVILPSYATLEKVIFSGLRSRHAQFEARLMELLGSEDKDTLEKMATTEDSKPLITLIRKFPKTFKSSEMSIEIDTFNKLQPLFPMIERVVVGIGLSKKNIEYFSSMVNYYSITKLRQLSKNKFYLYLVCYLYQRYFQMSDVLIHAFTHHVRKITEDANEFGNNKYHAELVNLNKNIIKASKLLSFYADDKIDGGLSFSAVRDKAYKILKREDILPVINFLSQISTDIKKYQWEFYESNHNRITNMLRKLFLSLTFDCRDDASVLLHQQLVMSQEELKFGKKLTKFDARLIKRELKPFLLIGDDEGKANVNMIKAEMLLYIRLKDRLDHGKFYVQNSLSYKRYEDDLTPAEQVPEKVEEGKLVSLRTPAAQWLASKKDILETKLISTAKRLEDGENAGVVLTDNNGKTKWSVKRNPKDANVSEDFYRNIPQQHIGDVLAAVNNHTDFASRLTHVRTNKKALDLGSLIACIVANGSRYGTHNMANLCNLSYDVLRNVEKNHLRLETLHAANDVISNATAQLPVFKYYNIQEDKLHASYDGQRFESRFNTISTNFCSKYFGRGKGVSAVSLVANHIPVNAKMMGLNGHESYYLYDVLFNNTSEIQPDVISTDTHGTNQFNFALLDLNGWCFAPRYANVGKVLAGLFTYTEGENGISISLSKPINFKLIENDWPLIQQIIVSLNSRDCSQATLVKKLSRFRAKENPFKALAEYDRLIKCIYLLDFIDDNELRRYVQKALNRGESYHQLQRTIAQVNGGRFRGNSDSEIHLWYECSRLIANCVIYFNASLLSVMVSNYEATQNLQKLEAMKRCSPVAWSHINFNGSYTFSANGGRLDINKLAQALII